MEKAGANLSSRGMAQCVTEMWEKVYGLIDFMLKDLQAWPALDPAHGSKLRAMPEVPKLKEEG